ncbi:hypothetical protein [uncultured Cohaesibacter sp.]|uniref:hypothetical protein n=1 Tax=uncultured Cohaesibacter sp. TaxID=1002546 RepID=UPI0029C70009|nr:hypothetical protein [uncultured Cohaesibacter sp.]
MGKATVTIGLLASLSTAIVFSIPDSAKCLSGGRKAAEAASIITTMKVGVQSPDHILPSPALKRAYEFDPKDADWLIIQPT